MNNQTLEKLQQLKCLAMAKEYQRQSQEMSASTLSFDQRLTLLVDREYESRTNNSIAYNIKKAELSDSSAYLEDINYKPERKLNRDLITQLSTNQYLEDGLSITIIGASGCGKTWLSNAFGIHACRQRYKVKYFRLPDLFIEIEVARLQGHYQRFMKQLNKFDLIILDEFLLTAPNENERNDLLELIEKRINQKSIIFCSQWTPQGWHQKLGEGAVADAILDRITNSSYNLTLHGSSMREEYSRIK